MYINVQISLGPDEFAGDLSGNATELAEAILEAVGGDSTKDVVNVSISDSGSAGSVQMVPVPEAPEELGETETSGKPGKPDKPK